MPVSLRVTLELGPKGKKVAAVAPDWPGLARGAATKDRALARLQAYLPRYVPVAALAGMSGEFPADATLELVEEYPGTGSTDFWGISFAFSSIDCGPMTADELARQLAILQACWQFFDQVAARVPAELRKGPRGGGRDRDHVIRHTLGAETDWAAGLGVRPAEGTVFTPEGRITYREAYLEAIRTRHAEGRMARKWPLRYLIRHTAFHSLDHAWEMEDRDPGSA